MTIWTGSSYVFLGVEGPLVEALKEFRYDFDDDFHMTTHFLGKEPLSDFDAPTAIRVARMAANLISPVTLEVKEFTTFGPPTAPARVARFDAPDWLYRWRQATAETLETLKIPVSKDWPWEPHMTYSYGFELDVLEPIEEKLLKEEAILTITSLCAYDGRAKLVVPL
jgi:2'-5' RNA ligase